jgi:hypothetical protein
MFSSDRVVVIDRRLAMEKFGSENAVGRTIRIPGPDGQEHAIVGVAATTRPVDPMSRVAPKLYVPMRGLRYTEALMLVRYQGSASDAERQLRTAVAALDSNVTPSVRPVEQLLASAVAPVRMAAAAATALGTMALVLACTGIYGVVSFAVGRRRREVGVRMALGADRRNIFGLVVWQGMKPVLAGCAAGIAAAMAGAQLIRAMLYGVSPMDPLAFGATACVLIGVALLAMLVPARQAVHVEPSAALRHD